MRGSSHRSCQICLIVLLLLSIISGSIAASDLTLTSSQAGGWQLQLSEADLAWGPGSDLTSTYLSSTVCDQLTIAADTSDTPWCIVAALQYSVAPLTIELRISDDGTGDNPISCSEVFTELSTGNSLIINGVGSRSGIGIQYRISGCSIETMTRTSYDIDISYVLCL